MGSTPTADSMKKYMLGAGMRGGFTPRATYSGVPPMNYNGFPPPPRMKPRPNWAEKPAWEKQPDPLLADLDRNLKGMSEADINKELHKMEQNLPERMKGDLTHYWNPRERLRHLYKKAMEGLNG